ncbi:MAG TPA: nucleotidyltransferase family protein [Acidimicrobiales bacterium]|nr:nucleotidyltransferase family protein [Acidimicrobiales bacterium]
MALRAPKPGGTGPTTGNSRPARAARQALAAAVQWDIAGADLQELCQLAGSRQVATLALDQGVAGWVHDRIVPFLGPVDAARLTERSRTEAIRHIGYLRYLDTYAKALDAAGASWAVLKGPVLTELTYDGTPRGYSDIDILVAPRHFQLAVAALASAGLSLYHSNWPLLTGSARGQLTLARNGAPLVDLHWHTMYKRSAREHFQVPTEEILERRRSVDLGSTKAWTLETVDFTLHVALHAALSGGHRLRWLVDVQRCAARVDLDWDELVTRCLSWKAGLPVAVAFERARRCTGAGVPKEVVETLAGSSGRRALVRSLSGWSPGGYLPRARSAKTSLTRSLRPTWSATAGAFAAEVAMGLRELVQPGLPEQSRARLARHCGGQQGFDAYIRMVQSADRFGHLPPS